MIYYELRRLYSKPSTKVLCLILIVIAFSLVILAIDYADWVNSDGTHSHGIDAIHQLKEAKELWAGPLTEERIAEVIEANKEKSNDYVNEQGYLDITLLINRSFSSFKEYDYTTIDRLSVNDAQKFYSNRVEHLIEWLNADGTNQYNEIEQNYLVEQYNAMDIPLFYESSDGWVRVKENIAAIITVTVIVNCLIVTNIFTSEKQYHEDSIYFSTYHGRDKGIVAKLNAGIAFSTGVYIFVLLIYTSAILFVFGTSGAECMIQAYSRNWKSMYNITNLEEYLLIFCGGYIGCIFMSMLSMFVSAWTRSSVISLLVSYSILFLTPILGALPGMSGDFVWLLPDQLLAIHNIILQMKVYSIGGIVLEPIRIIFTLYSIFIAALYPLTYHISKYKKL